LANKRLILIVINPAAGRSSYKKRLWILEKTLAEANIKHELFFTEADGAGRLKDYLNRNPHFDDLLALGGDGTLNYVVNESFGSGLPVSIVSNGTGNDAVKSIHGILDFEKQLEIAVSGKVKAFDLGICNGRYFVNGVGVGFDGEVVKEMVKRGKKRGRHIDYLLTVLRIIAGFKEKALHFEIDDQFFEKKVLLMTISNGTTFGGGFIINPFAKTNDGLLDVCVLNEIRPIQRFWHLPKLKTGSHYKIKYTDFYQASEIKINETNELVAHLDGEYLGHPPFRISVIKQALRFTVPA
jgi:YegS/Rv2252/BmrU family lipid kinase